MELVAPQFLMEAAQWLRDYITAIRGGRWHPFTFLERKARAATRNRTWGPTGTMLAELAELSKQQEHCQVIFAVMDYRIRSPEHKWLCVYKALQVLEYLVQRGSEHCCTAAQEMIVPLAALQNFAYVGPDRKDYGQNVRLRAEAVKSLILDTEGLSQKRAQLAARAANMKFAGYSREDLLASAASKPVSCGACASLESPPAAMAPLPPVLGNSGEGTAGNDGANPVSVPVLAAPGSPVSGSLSPSSFRPPSLFLTGPNARTGQQSNSLRGAGETKGITFEQNKRQLEQLRQLTLLEGNRTCADCASTVAAARPTWASINLGVFICMRCAGIHRGLGVHISKVRSTTLDTWLPEQVATMARLGNRRANAHFEAELDPSLRPQRDNTIELERFIRLKYADKVWAAKAPWPPEDAEATVKGPAASQVSANGRQSSGTPLRSPSPMSGSNAMDPNIQVSPSSWPPVTGSTGGGFGDAPPAWPSQAALRTLPSSAQPNWDQSQAVQPQPVRAPTAQGGLSNPQASPAPSGKSGAVLRLLPPPPPGPSAGGRVGFGAAAGAAPRSREGGFLSSSSDLLQLDSDSDDDAEEGGGGTDARAGGAGGPSAANAALWDLLDPTMDVMTWLDRVEGAQQQQKQQQNLHQQNLHQPQHHRTPSAPLIGGAGPAAFLQAIAAGEATLSSFLSPPMGHPSAGTPGVGQAAAVKPLPSVGDVRAGVNLAAGPAIATSGPGGLPVTQSIIMTAEFPVYDLLTPLPTGADALVPRPPAAAAAMGSQSAAAWPLSTPPGSVSYANPPAHLRHPAAPHSAPVLQPHGGASQPFASGSGASVTATTASTPTQNLAGGTPNYSLAPQRNSGMRPNSVMMRGGAGVGVGVRAGAVQSVTSAAGPAPAVDLDNLLAMQLDSLGTSLAVGAGGSSVGGSRPTWQPAATAVGSGSGIAGRR